MQFFLQGIGLCNCFFLLLKIDISIYSLVSGLPMEAGLVGLGRLSRSMSMEDADRPRRSSGLNSSSPGTASPPIVGSPPKF
jgi:hypothetical protein